MEGKGEIPPAHYSSAPAITDWVLIGYNRLNEVQQGDYSPMEYCYLALFCKKTGEDHYRFKFQWRHSDHLQLAFDGNLYPVDEYAFAGVVYRNNGANYELLWTSGTMRQTGTFVTDSQVSPEIKITSWFGVGFAGFLMAHYLVERSTMEKVFGYSTLGLSNILVSLSLVTGTWALAIPLSVLVQWKITEWLEGEESTSLYHEFGGRLDILNAPESCIKISNTYGFSEGYDLPDVIEEASKRRDAGEYAFWVQCVFPSKIHIDFYSLFKDSSGEFSDQSETIIRYDSQRFQYRIVGFPDNPENVEFSIDQKTAQFNWDVSDYFNDNDGILNAKTRKYLHSGGFFPDDPIYDYYELIGAANWDVPVLNFEIILTMDYELPEAYENEYPASPIGSVYQVQKFVFAVDYYTLGCTEVNAKILKDCEVEYKVTLGDEDIPGLILAPLIPIIIGYQMLQEGGIFIDLPDEVDDYYILPPDRFDGITDSFPEDPDPDKNIQFRDQEGITKEVSQYTVYNPGLKDISNYPVVVPDPEDTVFICPSPGIIPESFKEDPPDFAVDGTLWNSAEGNLQAYRNLIERIGHTYESIAREEIERRKEITLMGIPGEPDPNNVLTIVVKDITKRYQLSVQLPNGTLKDLFIMNPLTENELCSFTLTNIPGFILIPGSEEFNDLVGGVIVNLPDDDDATVIGIQEPGIEGDSLSLITTPEPEKHVIIHFDFKENDHVNYLSLNIVENQITDHVRSFLDIVPDLDPDTLCLANFVKTDVGFTAVTTTVPSEPLPISTCILDDSPIAFIEDLPDESGLYSTADPGIPSYMISDDADCGSGIFTVSLNHNYINDDEIGVIVSEKSNIHDGILIRGMTSVPSSNDYGKVSTWLVSPEGAFMDTINVRKFYWNYIYSRHVIAPGTPIGEYHLMIHHPGSDGEFFTMGSQESDARYLQSNGVESFISNARTTHDDLFFVSAIKLEEAEVSIEQINENGSHVTVGGFCKRLDGVRVNAILDDGDGNMVSAEGYTMFQEYNISIDVSEIPGGTYKLIVTDGDGNLDEKNDVEVHPSAPG